MHWCKSYSALSVIDWKNIIFSDESRIERHSLRRRYIRRQIYQRYEKDGSRMLIRCPISFDSNSYQTVLDNGLPDLLDKESVFMHDGVP